MLSAQEMEGTAATNNRDCVYEVIQNDSKNKEEVYMQTNTSSPPPHDDKCLVDKEQESEYDYMLIVKTTN
jgi:hypothetical protein